MVRLALVEVVHYCECIMENREWLMRIVEVACGNGWWRR